MIVTPATAPVVHIPTDPARRCAPASRPAASAKPWEVARLAAFLASDAARYINGADIAIDGGVTAVSA